MKIPEDPYMLLSFINMKLRDSDNGNLSELCKILGCEENEIKKKLNDAGFEYIEEINQFR